MDKALTISTSPFVLQGASTTRLMREVVLALIPVLAASFWFFGITSLLVCMAAVCGALATEWLFETRLGKSSLADSSALLTGLLLGLTLPPGIPLWMAFLGGFTAIALGKVIWGGLGANMFNPALLGRAFLQAAFPEAMTTWTATRTNLWHIDTSTLAMPLMAAPVDAVSSATPLGLSRFQGQLTEFNGLLVGNISGSLGETSALILLVCGLWLGLRKVFDWRTPVALLLSIALFSGLLHLLLPDRCPSPLFMFLSGGLLFAAVFMVTDPVTTPITPHGMWLFGAGAGLLIVVIRVFGGLPEGVMYAILFMNALTPHINQHTQPRHFGGGR